MHGTINIKKTFWSSSLPYISTMFRGLICSELFLSTYISDGKAVAVTLSIEIGNDIFIRLMNFVAGCKKIS